jgi:hypothetical protein
VLAALVARLKCLVLPEGLALLLVGARAAVVEAVQLARLDKAAVVEALALLASLAQGPPVAAAVRQLPVRVAHRVLQ